MPRRGVTSHSLLFGLICAAAGRRGRATGISSGDAGADGECHRAISIRAAASSFHQLKARALRAWVAGLRTFEDGQVVDESTNTIAMIPGKLFPAACSGRDNKAMTRKRSNPSPCTTNHKLTSVCP